MRQIIGLVIGLCIGIIISWFILYQPKPVPAVVPEQPVVVATPVPTPTPTPAPSIPFSDEFQLGELDKRWHIVGNPNHVKFDQKPGHVTLLSGRIEQRPVRDRVFSVEVKFDYFPSEPNQSVVLGLIPLQNKPGFVHLKLFSGNGILIDVHTWQYGASKCTAQNLNGLAGGTYYLRAVRVGPLLSTYCSLDGITYYPVRQCDVSKWENVPCKLEISTFNHANKNKTGKIHVDYFRVMPDVALHPTNLATARQMRR